MYSAERQSKGPWPKDMQTFRCPKPLSNCSRYDIADTSILRGKKLSHAMTAMSSMFSSLASPAKNDAHCAFCHCHTCQTSGNSYQSYGSPFTSDSIGSLIQEPKKLFSHGWPSIISKPQWFHLHFPNTFEHVRAFSSVWLWASPWMSDQDGTAQMLGRMRKDLENFVAFHANPT